MTPSRRTAIGCVLVLIAVLPLTIGSQTDPSRDATQTADIANIERRVTRLEHDQDQRSDRLQTLIWGLLATSILNLVAGEWRRRTDGTRKR